MTYRDARAKMAEIAKGRYHSLYYQEQIDQNGDVKPYCRLYLDPGISSKEHPTWEMAFISLDHVMNGVEGAIIEEQQPEEPAQEVAA